jgi:ketosteroid isomerase-like protein
MRNITTTLGAILMVIVSLTVPCVSFAAGDNKNVKALVAVDDDWSNAAVAKDVDRVASFYAADGVAFPPDEPVAVGSAATRKVWANYFADPTYQISWKTTSAGVQKDLGWTAGTFRDSSKGSDGKTVAKTGKYVCVWKKDADGKWKAIRDIWNYDGK